MRVVIVDDEVAMRQAMRKALGRMDSVEVAGEAGDGISAVEAVDRLRPDCVFMDVEMPGCDGVEAARRMLDVSPKLMIVFITAHQEYMPQAFELYAFDYMVKPFKLSRLAETVRRVKEALTPQPTEEPLYFKTKDGGIFLRPDEMYIIQRENRQTTIITQSGRHCVHGTLTELSEMLPADIFLRSHKSYIINIHHIKGIFPYGRWTYLVKFYMINEDALLNREKANELDSRRESKVKKK